MLSVLIEGTLIAAPVRRTSSKGSTFVTAQVRCNADDGESLLCSVIAFQASTAEALAGLAAGDTVAVAGPAALSQWEKNGEHKVGLKVTATRVLSVYDAGMRRKAASQERSEPRDSRPPAPPPPSQRGRPAMRRDVPARSTPLEEWENDEPV
jgi:single-stranded DNA-binding protein